MVTLSTVGVLDSFEDLQNVKKKHWNIAQMFGKCTFVLIRTYEQFINIITLISAVSFSGF